MRFDEQLADCRVYTFKEGLLSKLAHDLELRVGRFSIVVAEDGGAVEAEFEAGSLTVVGAVRGGRVEAGLLSAGDLRTIEQTIRDEVLATRRYPMVRFRSTEVRAQADGNHRVVGVLALHGHEREIAFDTRREARFHLAEVTLHQPDFGIRPYTAMLGTLKLRPEVRVRVAVPLAGPIDAP